MSNLNIIFIGKVACKTMKCDQCCLPTPSGAVCICHFGYTLASNKTCIGMY